MMATRQRGALLTETTDGKADARTARREISGLAESAVLGHSASPSQVLLCRAGPIQSWRGCCDSHVQTKSGSQTASPVERRRYSPGRARLSERRSGGNQKVSPRCRPFRLMAIPRSGSATITIPWTCRCARTLRSESWSVTPTMTYFPINSAARRESNGGRGSGCPVMRCHFTATA